MLGTSVGEVMIDVDMAARDDFMIGIVGDAAGRVVIFWATCFFS